jgi:putative FmdB family regulatory protein
LPTYEYACRGCKARFEVSQRITADPLTTCEKCGGALRRVVFPVGVVYKGSGFYTTDYARKNGGSSGEATGATDGNAKGESKTEKSGEKKDAPAKSSSEPTTSAKD